MKVFIPNAEIIRKDGVPNKIGFSYSRQFEDSVTTLLETARKMRTSQLSVEIKLPFRPRSVGYRSQNARFHGHCSDLASQIIHDGEPVYTAEEIKEAMKRIAVTEGYPTKWSPIDSAVVPIPTRKASMDQMKLLLDCVQRYADEHGLWLHEYAKDGSAYRSVGGRTKEEMEDMQNA